ncbi:MAG TPA: MFS transporter [Polyangiales bacterium]|nr:MFS transporter [Polyangiales bacterium]
MKEAQTISTTKARLPRTVIALGFTSFLTDIGSEMIFPLLPVFIASLGGAPTFIGLVEGVADATSSVLKLVSGMWADRMPRKKPLVLLGYGIASFSRPLMGWAVVPWHVLGIRTLDRIGKGIRTSPRDVLISSSVDAKDAGRAFGFQRALDHAGAVLGPLIATLLLSSGWSMREVFLASIVPGVLAILCVMIVQEPVREVPTPVVRAAASAASLPLRLKLYLGILGVFALGNASDAFLLLRSRELGVDVALLPILWTCFHVVKVGATYVFGRLSDRVSRIGLLQLGWLVYFVTYLLFGQASEAWHAWALFGVYGLFYGLTEPVERALIKEMAPSALQGRAYGYFNLVSGLCAIPAGLLTGYLWQELSPAWALQIGALFAAFAGLLLFFWSRTSAREPA